MSHKNILWHNRGVCAPFYFHDIGGVIITNNTYTPFEIKKGNRIAQFTVKPVLKVELEEVDELSSTERGTNGYGSSGI